MKRNEIYREMEQMLGVVPGFFAALPDATLELEWRLFQKSQVEPGPIPGKYRELIGVAVAASARCRFCTFFHTEMAKLEGATAVEIEDAIHYAKSSAGWSTYINGLGYDFDTFREEVQQACAHVRAHR